MRRNNRFLGLSGVAMVLFLFLLFPCLYAQDAIPALSRPLEPLRIPGETKEMHRGMRLITVHDSLPASFTHSLDNVIEDESRSLSPFFHCSFFIFISLFISLRALIKASNCSCSCVARTLTLNLASLVLTAGYTIPIVKIPFSCNILAIS